MLCALWLWYLTCANYEYCTYKAPLVKTSLRVLYQNPELICSSIVNEILINRGKHRCWELEMLTDPTLNAPFLLLDNPFKAIHFPDNVSFLTVCLYSYRTYCIRMDHKIIKRKNGK